jgi:hypothetical protein
LEILEIEVCYANFMQETALLKARCMMVRGKWEYEEVMRRSSENDISKENCIPQCPVNRIDITNNQVFSRNEV